MAVKISDLATVETHLPVTIDGLQKFIIVGRARLEAVRSLIRVIDQLPLAKEVREQKKEEAQMLAGALLDAEGRIGQLLKERPEYDRSSRGGTSKPLPEGITRKQSYNFQRLADHLDIIEQVKAEAVEDDDLPTRTEVLRRIKEQGARPEEGYWIVPPEIYEPLNKQFRFNFDPCPSPRPKNFDGLNVGWESNWVNPPFWAGITVWVNKAIEEQGKGKTSVLILLDSWVAKLLEAGSKVRSLGFRDWVHSKDQTRRKAPRPSFLFILRGKKEVN
jgi:hypothetical protein